MVGGDYITTETGTGLVHTAPGHGQEDYVTGLKYNLPLLSPVDDAGRFTAEAGERFKGLNVLKVCVCVCVCALACWLVVVVARGRMMLCGFAACCLMGVGCAVHGVYCARGVN